METPSEIKKMHEFIEDLLDSFKAKATRSQPEIYENFSDEIIDLFETSGGRIQPTADNLKKLSQVKQLASKVIQNSSYISASKEVLSKFRKVGTFIDDYYSSILPSYQRSASLYTEMYKIYEAQLIDRLIGSGLEANFTRVVAEVVQQNIVSGTSSIALRARLKEYIIKKNKLGKIANTLPMDPIEQFARSYMDGISQELGFKHFLYSGTTKRDTRSFCSNKKGKVFTLQTVKRWASQSWAGKNDNTTKDNIKILLGGYNCTDVLIPITEDLYRRFKSE